MNKSCLSWSDATTFKNNQLDIVAYVQYFYIESLCCVDDLI
jgi:hypothetical protein